MLQNQTRFREERHSELKKEVKKLLLAANDPFKELDLVDKIQQLGVGYHYEVEIEELLQRACHYEKFDQADLYHTSLRFRLLRQAGFYVSPGNNSDTIHVHVYTGKLISITIL